MLREFTLGLQEWLNRQYDPMGFSYRSEEDCLDGYGFDLRELDFEPLLAKISAL